MKILFAIKAMDDIKGGAERVLADISGGLAGRGHDVALLSFDKPGGKPFYPLNEKVRRICLGLGSPKEKTGAFETLSRLGALRAAVKKEKPDAVVAFMHSMFIPVTIALTGTGIPVIASEHIVPQHYEDKKLEFALLVVCGLAAKKITVLSERIKKSYPSILHGRMEVMPNPVQPPAANNNTVQKTRKVILNVGRLAKQKNQKDLIAAFASLAARFPDWDLRIIGEGELKNDLMKQIVNSGFPNRVTLVGSTRNIEEEYKNADIFALPSLYESFGLVTAEAMSHGLPAVGYADCPGTNELIRDGENGLLAAGGFQAFADKLEDLMQSEELRARLGKNGIATAQQFAPEKVTTLWEDLIRRSAAG